MAWTARFPRTTDLSIPLGGGHVLRLVDRPGRTLDAPARSALVADLREVADQCVSGGTLRYGVLSGATERLERVVVAIAYERVTGRPVGFNAPTWLDLSTPGAPRRVLHAGLCMIVPGARRGGLLAPLSSLPALLAFVRNGLAPLWVTNVTQVPSVAGMFSVMAGEVYPEPGRLRPPSARHRRIAEAVMARHRAAFGVGAEADFDPARFVIRNAYTGGSDDLKKTWWETSKHRDERFNRMCHELLDYERGDDLLQVGKLTVRVMARLVASTLVRLARRVTRHVAPLPSLAPMAATNQKRVLR